MLGLSLRVWAIIAGIALVVGAAYWIYSEIKLAGREEVTSEINTQNAELNAAAAEANQNIVVRVVTEDGTIRVESRRIEDRINAMPDESISNVTRARLERVREQQRSIPEANSTSE